MIHCLKSLRQKGQYTDYFQDLQSQVNRFSSYQSETHEIDFLMLRRFLMTTYNNLVEIDMNLMDTSVYPIRNDVLKLSQIYDQFKLRALHVKKAFFELFLDNHDVFVKYQKRLDENKETNRYLRHYDSDNRCVVKTIRV